MKLTFIIALISSTIIISLGSLEFVNSIEGLLIMILISALLTSLINYKSNSNFKIELILGAVFVSIIPAYMIMYSLNLSQTNSAYDKVKTIGEEKLTEYFKTNNIQLIPQEKRYTWIGIQYKKINIVENNMNGKIKAVGWKGKSVFAYYNIEEKVIVGSYH
jgi:hypothetical protein